LKLLFLGKNAVGVEVPNVEMSMVRLIELMRTIPKEKENKKLLFLCLEKI
jgi:DNA segregation ATPase FtsK/SpoIIIE-like protein